MKDSEELNLIFQSYAIVELLTALFDNKFYQSNYFDNLKLSEISKHFLKECSACQGTFLLTLYAMLVIPKEILFEKFPTEFGDLNEKLKSLIKYETSYKNEPDPEKNIYDYIRHIRNALVHARVQFIERDDKNGTDTIFIDKAYPDNKQSCSIKIKSSDAAIKQSCSIKIKSSDAAIIPQKIRELYTQYFNSCKKNVIVDKY